MDNIVNLGVERPRPQRQAGVSGDGARILFFTGVRYCREIDDTSLDAGDDRADGAVALKADSGLAFDLAAH